MKFVSRFNWCFCLVLVLASYPARAQQREAIAYDLGPEVYSTYRRSNGYPWYAWGYVYSAGTYSDRPACEYDDSGVGVKPVGIYAIYGSSGNPAEHLGTYRITVAGVSRYFRADSLKVLNDDGKFKSYLFDLLSIKVSGQQPSFDSPQSFIEFTGRSTQCFGGAVKLFLGVGDQPQESRSRLPYR